MKTHRRVCVLLIASLISASSAVASDLSGYTTAQEAFESLVKSEIKKNTVPRQADPKVAALLDQVADSAIHSEKTALAPGDFPQLLKACTRTQGILLEYVMFATLKEPAAAALMRDKNIREFELLMDRSFGTYAPEMGRLESFVLLCNGRAISLSNEFSANPLSGQALQSFRKGVDLMRRSNHKAYTGSVRRAMNVTFSEDYRLQLLTALSNAAPQHGLIFTPELREDVIRQVKQGSEALQGEMKSLADAIVAKLSASSCNRLCSD